MAGTLNETDRARAVALHLRLEPLTLQEVVVQVAGAPAASQQGKDKRMNTWVNVARYQLTNRYVFVTGPWLILALNFLIFAVVAAQLPGRPRSASLWGRAVGHLHLSSSSPGRWASPCSCRSRWPSA